MRRWTIVIVAVFGLMLVPLAGPAFGQCVPILDDPDADAMKTDDGGDDPVGGCDPCADAYCCPDGEDIPTPDGDVDGGADGSPYDVPPPGRSQGGITQVMDSIVQQLATSVGDPVLDAARSDHNTVKVRRHCGGHVGCLGMHEETTEIGGIQLTIDAPDLVAKIHRFGIGAFEGDELTGRTQTALEQSRVAIRINAYSYAVATTDDMSFATLNEALVELIKAQWEVELNGDYWIIGNHRVTGESPRLVHVQSADDGIREMEVELRPFSLEEGAYDVSCAEWIPPNGWNPPPGF